MKNVTITLDEEVARWARIRAAERDTSLSRLVGKLLREKMLDDLNPSAYKWKAPDSFSPGFLRLSLGSKLLRHLQSLA